MTDLSIITVSYNTEKHLRKCLESVYAHPVRADFEYFVVDNVSTEDRTVAMVREEFPQVVLIENPENVGFSRANNTAIERAAGRFVLLLNPDCEVLPEALDKLVDFMDARPEVAVLGCRLAYPGGVDQGASGRVFPTPLSALFGRTSFLTRRFPNNRFSRRLNSFDMGENATEPYEVDWVSGACMLVRMTRIQEAGMLDGRFFMYWEDADWCYRIKQTGGKVYCYHEANVIHYESGSSKTRLRPIIAWHRSVYLYYRKHINPARFHILHPFVIAGLLARGCLLLLVNGANSLRGREDAWYRPTRRTSSTET